MIRLQSLLQFFAILLVLALDVLEPKLGLWGYDHIDDQAEKIVDHVEECDADWHIATHEVLFGINHIKDEERVGLEKHDYFVY